MEELDSFLESLEEDDLDKKEAFGRVANRDGVIFLIDCTKTMLEPAGTPEGGIGLTTAFSCCRRFLKTKAVSSASDLIGIVLMRTPLELPSPARICQLGSLMEQSADQLSERFGSICGHSDNQFSFQDALWTCQNMFISCREKLGYRRVFVFTDDANPHAQDATAKELALLRASDLRESAVRIDVLPVETMAGPFDIRLFYRMLTRAEGEEELPTRLKDLFARVLAVEARQRMLASLPLYLGPWRNAPAVGVAVYCLLRRTALPTASIVHCQTNQPVTVHRRIFLSSECDGDESLTEKMLLKQDLARGVKLGGRVTCFELRDLERMRRFAEKPGIYVLGFRSSPVEFWRHVRTAHFVHVDLLSPTGADACFVALLERCLARSIHPLCLYVQRVGSTPRLSAMLPQREERDTDGAQLIPPGFHLVFLPFADDCRELELPQAAETVVRKLRVEYSPEAIGNPALERHYALLEALALDFEEPEWPVDHSVPQCDAMKRRAGVALETLVAPLKMSSSTGFSAGLSENELQGFHETGQLHKLTVAQLKAVVSSFCNAKMPTNSLRKGQLIDIVQKHFDH